MSEPVAVLPRYQDPDVKNVTQQHVAATNIQPIVDLQSGPSKGILTSVYENKLIVLIIIIVILIISLVAYVIYRKEDPEKPKPTNRKQSPTRVGGGDDHVNGGNAIGAGTADDNIADPAPRTEPTREELLAMLAQGQNTQPAPVPPEVEPKPKNPPKAVQLDDDSKTNDEIMQLMEDEPDDEEDPVFEAPSKEGEPETPLESEQAPQGETTSTLDPTKCSEIVPPGRQCRNKHTKGDKCTRHAV
jgi:hypothetical protein